MTATLHSSYAKIIALVTWVLLFYGNVQAQTAPYALSPKWMLGYYGGIDFTSGSAVLTTSNPLKSEEMSSTMCEPNKNIVVYSNNYYVVGSDNVPTATLLTSSTSSTNGPVIIPNPAAPTTSWYLFTGNAEVANSLGGGTAKGGIRAYSVVKSGASVTTTYISTLAAGSTVGEQLYASSDGNGGYWIISREQVSDGTSSRFNSWRVTSGGIGSKVSSNGTIAASWSDNWQGTIKINRCQNKIAYVGKGVVEVFNWNRNTGQVGSLVWGLSGYTFLYGAEFSPSGNALYFTSYTGNTLYQLDLGTGSVYTQASWRSNSGTGYIGSLQLGLDGKIYAATSYHDTRPAYLGVISNPDVIGSGANYSATGFALGTSGVTSPSVFLGVSNIAWTNPTLPVISTSISGCTVDFSYLFRTYFLDNISVTAGSEVWNFGDGTGNQTGLGATPSHTYPSGVNSYTVTLTVTDAVCGQTWTGTTTVNTNCSSLPISLVNFNASTSIQGNILHWTTTGIEKDAAFEVQKSLDGTTFAPIGEVKAIGTKGSTQVYSFEDSEISSGIVYYRIAQKRNDVVLSYSEVTVVKNNSFKTSSVGPNPFTNSFTVEFGGSTSAAVKIYDLAGKLLSSYSSQGALSGSFGEELSKGTYIVSVLTETETSNYKVIKE